MYLYFKPDGKLFLRSKVSMSETVDESLTEMFVDDSFDFTVEGEADSEGLVDRQEMNKSQVEAALSYANKRVAAYPSIGDQLDKIFHEGLDAWKVEIQAVKDKYPKP
tara:strand:- start:213 stop:533 length:321 start_codon:yes stop_codon:yes gene_type:complete